MDHRVLVEAITNSPALQGTHIECTDELLVEACTYAMWEAAGGPEPPRNTLGLRPLGGIFHLQHTPLAFLHCISIQDPAEEAGHLAECAMFQRATEMFFAGQMTYPVIFLVEGGTPDFWMYLDIYQLGRQSQCIYKVGGHSVPLILPYTTHAAAIQAVEEVVLNSLAALVVPPAER